MPSTSFRWRIAGESVVAEVKRFHKENFTVDAVYSPAANLKFSTKIRAVLEAEFREPSEEFLRLLLKDAHAGKITQNVLDKFRPLVKRTVGQYFSDMFNDKLKSAIETSMWLDISTIDDLFQHRQVLIDTVVRMAGASKQAERLTAVQPA